MDNDTEPDDVKAIGQKMVQGTAWMVSMRWSLKLIGVVNTVIIARLLSPDDFGVIAMAVILVGFLTEISETNVAVALIRNKETTRDDYNSAWTIKVVTGALLTVILIALAPAMAAYYDDMRVETVIQIISLRCLINGFENIGVVDFRKNLEFAKEFRFWIYRRLTEIVIVLTLVFILRDYHALAIGMVVSAVITVFYSFTMSAYRPWFSLTRVRALWSISQWLMVDHGARFVGRRVDEFIIGGIAGSATVGNYYIASEISAMPTREVVMPAGRALIPTFSKVSHDTEESRKAFLRVLGLMAIYAFPAGVGISIVSVDLVPLLLGGQWLSAIPFFQWLGIYAALEAIQLGVRPYFLAHGGERAYAYTSLGFVALLVPAIVGAGHYWGVEAIAITRTGTAFLMVLAILFVIARLGYARMGEMISVLWRPTFACGVMWLSLHWLPALGEGGHVLSLLRDSLLGACIFTVSVLLLWVLSGRQDGPERTLFEFFLDKTGLRR